jgi:hypothetical protein
MAAQTLLLRRFLWRFEAAETGVALFLASWLFWIGLGAAGAAMRWGRRVTGVLSRRVWLPVLACAGLYFLQYALLVHMRSWAGVQEYEQFPLVRLVVGCWLANAPFCFVAGFIVPSACRRLADEGLPVSRVFAWEALGAAAGGVCLTLLLVRGVAPDPRDESEWFRYFPLSGERPGRFETGGGTTFYGSRGGTFYALSSRGVSETIPESGRAFEIAVLMLSQRPYAKEVVLLGEVPLATGLALEALRPDLAVVWCPCDAQYGVRLLAAVRESGVKTRVRAAGETPQLFLGQHAEGAFDIVLVAPPQATTLEGAEWRLETFAQRIRPITRRTGVALFALDCNTVAITPETCALVDVYVRSVRHSWPESGLFAAGAGGWWIAAQVPRLAYQAEDAVARFGMLKQVTYPAEAVAQLYDSARAKSLSLVCPALNPDESVLLPQTSSREETLSLGLADAIRRAYPALTPGVWLARIKALDGARLTGLLLVMLWMAPVALGTRAGSSRRLFAAWVAACGALGLTASLAILYRLQLGFGSLYLFAGAGGCLYLAGLFCGNRLSDGAVALLRPHPRLLRGSVLALTLAETGVALLAMMAAERAVTEMGVIVLCFAIGCVAGVAVPVAFAACGEETDVAAPVFVFSDAMGAAVAGLTFVLLMPLAGLMVTVCGFGALACGVSLCTAVCGRHARLTAGLALFASLIALCGELRDVRDADVLRGTAICQPASDSPEAASADARNRSEFPGVPRRLDVPRIRERMQKGRLATNTAAFWE